MGIRTRILAAALGVAVIVAGLLLVSSAAGRKVANPGAIAITSESGNFRVNNEEFDFDSSTQITFNGTLTGGGALTIPRGNVVFPDQFVDAAGYTFRIRITARNDATGVLNPLTGLTTLNASLRIDIDPQGGGPAQLRGDCRIEPINVALSTSKSGGVAYNTANGRVQVADHGFHVPGAQGCGSFLTVNCNSEINNAIGIPTSQTDAVITAKTAPIVQKRVRAAFTPTPNQGVEPLDVDFDASSSSAVAAVKDYRWDYDGNGTFDETTTVPSASQTYATPGVYQAKLRVTNVEDDFDETTRTITVRAREPDLAIDKSHAGDFVAGDRGTFAIDVTNVGTLATQGTVTVSDPPPEALGYVSATGDGWSCDAVGREVTCTRPGPVAPGEARPRIALEVDVSGAAIPGVVNAAEVSSQGDAGPGNNRDEDAVTVLRPEPTSRSTSRTTATSDSVGAGQALPPIGIRGNIAANAPAEVVNTATVATGGDANAANDSYSDPTTTRTLGVDMTIDKSHAGVFEQGEVESYRIVVPNQGTTGSPGPIVVSDTSRPR